MNNTIDQFMWGYQPHFQNSAKHLANALFGELDPELFSNVFLLGFLQDDLEQRHDICLEPEDCGYSQNTFNHTLELASQLHNVSPDKNLFISHAKSQENYDKRRKYNSIRNAIKQTLDGENFFKNVTSYISEPSIRDGYLVFVIIQLNTNIQNKYNCLQIESDETFQFETSLINATVKSFFKFTSKELQKENAGASFHISGIDLDGALKNAASSLMSSIAYKSKNITGSDLFEACNTISALRYEGEEGIGRIAIAPRNHPNIKMRLSLNCTIRTSEFIKIRKFLQLSAEDIFLVTDGQDILGLGTIVGEYRPANEDLYTINITGHHNWEVCHDSKCLMRVSYGKPRLSKERIEREKFFTNFKRLFPNATEENQKSIWEFVLIATTQKHGTMIVISSDAKEESIRLKNQSFLITPTTIDPDLVPKITSIDGAVLISPEAVCYSIGVILDGVASQNGDSSRGARFNSAIRYYETNPSQECCIIVISEDGMIDIIPDLIPQIDRKLIDDKIDVLENTQDISENGFYRKYSTTITWLEDHEFYLSQEQCDKINTIKKSNEKKIKEYDAQQDQHMILLVRRDLKPNAEMNESYFINNS